MLPASPKLLDVRRIWDHAPHNAFTDLIFYKGRWLCTFRESQTHEMNEDGQIRIIDSPDGVDWSSCALLGIEGVDLRDPKLSIAPDGRLLLLAGCTLRNREGQFVAHETRVAFSNDAREWTAWCPILERGEWLWRLTWKGAIGYGIAYRYSDSANRKSPWEITLFRTLDGVSYQAVTGLDVSGYPCEATVRFADKGQMIALVRREDQESGGAWLGTSFAPYIQWSWRPLGLHLDGPDFVVAANAVIWAAGRILDPAQPGKDVWITALCRITDQDAQPLLTLPSAGDNSYPGLELQDKILWISYYSSHEHKTAIYLAKIQL